MPYAEAMDRFGTDRPDLRFGLELVDLGSALRETEFKVFRSVLDGGGSIRGINAGKREVPRKDLDGFISRAQELGAKGLVWAFREGDGWRSPTAKFLSEGELAELNRLLGAEEGDLLLLVADKRPVTDAVLGQMRLDLGESFGLIDENEDRLVWIVDFPLFDYDEVEKRWDAMHHPFTAPAGRVRPERSGRGAVPGLRRGLERAGDRRRLDPYPQRRGPAAGLRRARDRRRRPPRRASASCSRRSASARRRTAASPTASTASSSASPGAETIRDVIAFPKTASGFDLAHRRARAGRRAAAARARRRDPQTGQSRPLRWGCGTGYPAVALAAWARADAGHVDDPRYEGWEVVRDFGDVRTARAWHQALVEAGIEAALTADWPLDRFGHGEISLCVPGDRWSEAEMHLSNLDVPDY